MIRIGTSGYSFQDWKGTVYPSNIKDGEMFAYYIDHYRLNTVEINYTYYQQPVARTFESMIKKCPEDFLFTVKLFSGITHEGLKPDPACCRRFLEGIKPVIEAGMLGCLLAQFPPTLNRSSEAWDYLLSLPDMLNGLPLVYEFRNKTWTAEETYKVLKEANIGYCAVDEPQVGQLMPLVPNVTSDIAYLRLHGRNRNWFTDPSQRYDYLYSEKELESFIPIIERMTSESTCIYVQFNNCHAGSALRNVKMLQYLLGMDLPPIQGELF
ncbi:MAG: DUF72 domain-containing protein [Armatimonadota bacterium]